MNRHLFKFMFCLYISTLIAACTFGNPPIMPTPTPIAPTRMPATATPAISAISPTLAPPTLAFTILPTRPSPTPIPTAPGGNPFHLVAEVDRIIHGSQWAHIQSAQDGTIWLLTDKGIARVSDSGWTVYLSGYDGYLIGIDATNRAWVISETGDSISAWDGTKWTKYSSEDGWTTVNNTSSFVELPGQIWLFTDIDVRVFDGARWKVISPEEIGITITPRTTEPVRDADSPPFPSFTIKVKAVQSTGEIWVGQCDHQSPDGGQGVRWFDGNTWQGKSTPVESGCIRAIQEDRTGNMWIGVSIGANEGLWRYDHSSAEWIEIKLPNRHEAINDLAFGPTDELWMLGLSGGGAGRSQTLYHLQEGVWQSSVTDDDPISLPQDILIDRAGYAWLAGAHSIYRIVDNKPQLVTDTMPLNLFLIFDEFDWTIDSAGRIWVVEGIGLRPEGGEAKVSLWLATP